MILRFCSVIYPVMLGKKILTPPTSINFPSCKICSLGGMCSVLVVVLSFIQKV